MKFTKIFSQEMLDQMVNEGLVRVQTHPVLPFRILNYTEQAQFKSVWNACTLACRGLIVDDKDNIIARPFEKFFNLGDSHAADIDWDTPVEVTDKKDGSMGILYSTLVNPAYHGISSCDGNWYNMATRGSFNSDQAIHATKLWHERYSHVKVHDGFTFIFEIVYPDNRIVLDYGGMDDLILLGAVDKRYGFVYGPNEAASLLIGWSGPKTEVFNYKSLREAAVANYRSNAEGLVVRSGRKMVKIKQADYIELHRLISMLSERSVWSQLKAGQSIMEICEALPDEFHDFVRNVGGELERSFSDILCIAEARFGEILRFMPENFDPKKREHRAIFARHANSVDHFRPHMFCLLDGHGIDELIWKQIKPETKKEDGYPAS